MFPPCSVDNADNEARSTSPSSAVATGHRAHSCRLIAKILSLGQGGVARNVDGGGRFGINVARLTARER